MRLIKGLAVLLLVVAISLTVCALPAAAVTPPADLQKNVKPGTGGYIVTFVKKDKDPMTFNAMASYGLIRQGEYKWHTQLVNYYTTSLPIDLYWGNTANSLRLRIYTPDGYLLGPYYDWSDGATNGNIYLVISRPGGVAQGTWYYEVYGDRVSGSQSYSI